MNVIWSKITIFNVLPANYDYEERTLQIQRI